MVISIFTTDTNLIVRSWDPQLTEITGLSGEVACGMPLQTMIPDLEKRGLDKRFQRVLNEGVVETLAPTFHHYLIPCPPTTPSRYFEKMQQRVTIAPLREKEAIVGTVVTIEDVTARLEQEREIKDILTPPEPGTPIPPQGEPRPPDEAALVVAIQSDQWQVRRQAIEQLVTQNTAEITEELVELLRREHRNPNVLSSLLQVLVVSHVDPVPALLKCLQDSDPDLRTYAALALGERKDGKAIPFLIEALNDPDKNVRYHAIEALGRLQATDAVEILIEIAESGDFFLAFPALDALMRINSAAVAPRLMSLLQNTLNWRVRREAVDSLAMQNSPEITTDLVKLLREHHQNPNILNSVLQVLALSNVDPIPALLECLREPDTDLRIYTALVLGERHDPRAIGPLIEALDDPDTNVRYHSIEALGFLGAVEAVDALVKLAQSGDFFLAFPALEALARIGDPTAAPHLISLLNDDLLAEQVADTLGQIGDADIVELIAAYFNKPNSPVISLAIAITNLYHRYEQLFGEGTHIADLTRNAIDERGIEHLIGALDPTNGEVLQVLVLILSWLEGERVEAALTQLLSYSMVRETVVSALVHYGKKDKVVKERICDLLITQLEAEDPDTRNAAIMTLGRIGSNRGVPALLNLLDEEADTVIVTATALAQIGDQQAFEPLLKLLGHSDIKVRLATVAALNSLGHPAMSQRVVTLLSDPDPLVRESAIKIAGYFAFEDCLELLLASTRDPEERVRRSAIEHLPYLENDDRILPTLIQALQTETPGIRGAAAHALGELESLEVIPPLLAGSEDPEPWVRYHSVRSLGKLAQCFHHRVSVQENLTGTPADPILEPLWEETYQRLIYLVQNDLANQVRAVAAVALGYLGQEEVVTILAHLIEQDQGDGEVARAAIMALGQVEHPSAIGPLLTALNSPNPERRLDALQAFRDRGGTDAGVALQWMAAADPETRVVQAAIESLAQMATAETIMALLELTIDPVSREACITALATRGGLGFPLRNSSLPFEQYIEAVAQGLHHVHVSVRCAAVEVLTRLKHPYASELLIPSLSDEEVSVRLAVINAFGNLGSHICDEQLTTIARTDPNTVVRRAAHKVLHQ